MHGGVRPRICLAVMRAYRDFLFFCGGNAEDAGKLK
jgi:hypothetical protein